ncbi:hypothetical protein QJS10_CPA08g01264 [Acorus calamus]|uniref:Secreted protein n=1 Tax=Acorus calamus TaxID=4465 RepID=A0AAV9E8Y2_ACOCL|nr:hypothetical protein QJS10_CPA08g01264 [Acorus calamus]
MRRFLATYSLAWIIVILSFCHSLSASPLSDRVIKSSSSWWTRFQGLIQLAGCWACCGRGVCWVARLAVEGEFAGAVIRF